MTAQEIITNLKSNKVARGCKISHCQNCVTIAYPQHKTFNPDIENHPFQYSGSQHESDLNYIRTMYSMAVNKGTVVHNNRFSIQIYLTNESN